MIARRTLPAALVGALAAALLLTVAPAARPAGAAEPPHGERGDQHRTGQHDPGTRGSGRHERRKPVTPCSRGLVALTFDDGPSATVTPRLVRLLQRLDVPATFFMVGSRVVADPGVARLVQEAGFAVGNHTWEHADLTAMSGRAIRHTVRATARALADAGVEPSRLVRPPYGAVDDRVRRVLADGGWTSVLWTIDPRDWADGTAHQVARRVISAVRPHRTNVVLQHDGVTRSPTTLGAVPEEVGTLERRGYCFAGLDERGNPTPPVPLATVSAAQRRVAEGGRVEMTVRLDRPTSRPTTAVVAAGGSATSRVDFTPARRRVSFDIGEQVAHFRLRTRQDVTDEPGEDVTWKVVGGRGTQSSLVAGALVRIVDDDPPPVVDLVGTTVRTSALLTTTARIGVRLEEPSAWDVEVVVATPSGRQRVSIPAGSESAALAVTLPPGSPSRPVRRLPVRIASAQHAVAGADATLVVQPPTLTRAQAVRAALQSVHWPRVLLRPLL